MELINKQYALASAISGMVRTDENGEKWIRTREVRESIINVPVIEAESIKHGRWKVILGDYAICTNCELYWIPNGDQYDYRYCPHCGAKMDEVEDDNENT